MTDFRVRELRRIALIALAGLAAGALTGQWLLCLWLATAGYLGWNLYQLFRLGRWFQRGGRFHPPQTGGVWGELYDALYRLQQRNRMRKRTLAQILDRYQEVFSALPDATVILARGGEIEWANAAAERLLGVRWPQDRGRRIDTLVRQPGFAQILHAEDHAEPMELPAPALEGMYLSARMVPYGKEQRLLVVRDITRLRHLEQVRHDFVANVSHELRTPLTVISGYIETMREEDDGRTRTWSRSLEQLHEQSARMQRIVEDLLLLARVDSGPGQAARTPVVIEPLLRQIREEAFVAGAAKAQTIELDCAPGIGLLGSSDELRSVFANLAMNAVQYTPERGAIRMRWWADEGGAHFTVQDNGVGIAPSHLPRLTERFYRVDVGRSRRSGGTGLGLAIVKHVLQRHDAELRIESRVGEGSTFYCDFPPERVHGW